MKPLDLPLVELALQALVLERLYLVHQTGDCAPIGGTEILASAVLRNMLQCFLVQPRDNGAALSILTDADDVALFVVYGDRLSFRRTKADGVYDYLFRRGLPGAVMGSPS